MMGELVEMHREFVRYYGPDTDGLPKWMEAEKLNELPSVLQKAVTEDRGKDLISLMPLYSQGNIEECMQTIQPVKYGEEVCFNGIFVLKASSSGLELGNSVWTIKGPRASITYLPSAVFVSAHALDLDYSSLKENDVILFSDLSSLNEMDEDTEKLDEHAMDETDPSLRRHSVLSDDGADADEKILFLCNSDDITEEVERISFICSCIISAIKSGGSVLIPIGRLGVILLLLELISETLHSSSIKVPIFMVSETAAEVIAFTNALPEWLCKSRQEKLFSGEALFGHVEILKEGKLFLFPHLHSKGLLAAWKEPCIVICPHWSLRLGPAVHLLRRWHADKRCLLVLEQGNDAELSLKPFMPLAIRVLECSFLSGVRAAKIDTLLEVLKPKFVMLPEGLKSRYSGKERAWSSLYYSMDKTIELPNFQEEFEVHLATDVALGLQPRQLNETTAVARLRTKLFASSGQYQLAAAEKQSDQSKWHLLHRDAVDPDRLLPALQEKGMVCSFDADDKSAGERSVLITSTGDALVKITSNRMVIYCDDERTSKHIYDALSSICNGI
ncbi:integrator complex subunit 9 homolog [Panicum virgatum]|uniref:integrator complex subunit 9 homolog n=1 Tax=Panicum virgatum TaxID=38727 RepID=UPI0019D4EFD7|nr:integrator complex subunit 9 homolog [Panicum virgatum]